MRRLFSETDVAAVGRECVARRYQRQPELAFPFEEMPSGNPGRLSDEDICLSLFASPFKPKRDARGIFQSPPPAQRLIRTHRNTVGKAEITQHCPRGFGFRVVGKKRPLATMLKQVGSEICQRKLAGRVGEVDRPIGGDIEVVSATKRQAIC